MAILLNIDASNAILYISISKDGVMLAEKRDEDQRNHASNLQPFVEAVLHRSNLKITEIDAVAVMNGPGSYTGLRVGLAAAKGYCFALDIPLICISNLAALAANYYQIHPNENKNVQALISPMKNELFIETYNADIMVVNNANHLLNNSNTNNIKIDSSLLSIGNVSAEIISYFSIVDFENILHNYMIINTLSYKYFMHNNFTNTINAEPNYLKKVYIN